MEKNPEIYDQLAEAQGSFDDNWYVLMDKPQGDLSRDDLINLYIKMLADVAGCSEQEARMKIYWVSTKFYYGFGAVMDEDTVEKFDSIPGIWDVYADSYEDVERKKYRGEPFINGEAVPYDTKYHEGWRVELKPFKYGRQVSTDEDEVEVQDESVPKHWIVYMKKRKLRGLSRDEIINSYIKTIADHLFNCSEEEARMKIYMVSTKGYFAFGVNLGAAFEGYEEEQLYGVFNNLPGVQDYISDSTVINLGRKGLIMGEPFDGKNWRTVNDSSDSGNSV